MCSCLQTVRCRASRRDDTLERIQDQLHKLNTAPPITSTAVILLPITFTVSLHFLKYSENIIKKNKHWFYSEVVEDLFLCIYYDAAVLKQQFVADVLKLKVTATICTKKTQKTGTECAKTSKQAGKCSRAYPLTLLLPRDRPFLLAFRLLAAWRQITGQNCRVWTRAGLQTEQLLLEVGQKCRHREAASITITPPWVISEGGRQCRGLAYICTPAWHLTWANAAAACGGWSGSKNQSNQHLQGFLCLLQWFWWLGWDPSPLTKRKLSHLL